MGGIERIPARYLCVGLICNHQNSLTNDNEWYNSFVESVKGKTPIPKNIFPLGRQLITDLDRIRTGEYDYPHFVHAVNGIAWHAQNLAYPPLGYSPVEQQEMFIEGLQEAIESRGTEFECELRKHVPYLFPDIEE